MQQFLSTETLIIELLLIASLVAIVVRRLQIPYTVALVVVGLLLTAQSPLQLELTPELILALFVPPLIFEAAFHINLIELRTNLYSILIYAIPGVILTMLIVGGLLSITTTISLPSAMIFGALIAATDPVAVVSLFRILGVPKQLAVLVEGESLSNDGTALVLFNLMVAMGLTGEFNLLHNVVEFIRVSAGGLAVGLALGWLSARLIARVDDYLIETTLTTVLAYGSYLIAEQLHFSGVLAVVAAGLVNGNLGQQGMSPTTRIVLFNFWEYFAFLANSLIFLLIGLDVDIAALIEKRQPIFWAIVAVLLARAVVVYGLGWISGRLFSPISTRWKHIQAWGGLRGALSLALALSLPAAIGSDRETLRTLAFGVVLFTLLVQAPTMRPLIRKLGIVVRSQAQIEYEMRHARLTAMRAAEIHLERRYREGLISTHAWEILKPKIREQTARLAEDVRATLREEPALEAEELDTARREILRAQRSAILGLHRDGVISDEVYEKLAAEVDGVLSEGGEAFWFAAPEESPSRKSAETAKQPAHRTILVEPGSICDGRKIRHVPWPEDFIVVNVRRGEQTIIPSGDTLILAGDKLDIIASEKAWREAIQLFQTASRNL
ncbi:MAG: Na+/H+ antiporter [Anaerolineales bacterium]|nr:Na+/H+ antiporter [Anaerolineales bacterium]